MKLLLVSMLIFVAQAASECSSDPSGNVQTGQLTTGPVPLTEENCYCQSSTGRTPCQLVWTGTGYVIGCAVGFPSD